MANDQPKLYTKKTFFIAFTAVLIGVMLSLYREYKDTGSVSGVTIGASLAVLVVGIVMIVLVGRFANKPEQ